MNDVKDIINKMKFVPEHMQDEVFKNIKACIEKEINKSCNPIDVLIEKLKELDFGKTDDEFTTNKIINMIIKSAPCDWFWMNPIYCASKEITYEHTKIPDFVNGNFINFIECEIGNLDEPKDGVWLVTRIAELANNGNIDVFKDSFWVWKDGANGEIWMHTSKQFAQEMLFWFEKCFCGSEEEDVEWAYRILSLLEESSLKKE